MVGRPPLPLGTHGKVRFIRQSSGNVQARVAVRDYDGRIRLVGKVGPSKAAAERSLREALRDRQAPSGDIGVTGATLVSELAEVWLAEDHGWSTNTDQLYRKTLRLYVLPALGELRLREVNAGVVARMLAAVGERSGTAASRTSRSVLSGMFRIAVRDGAVATNPVRDAGSRIGAGKRARKRPKSLSPAEEQRLVELFVTSERARALDVVDLVDWMLATGCRIGEALAASTGTNDDGAQLIDVEAGTWEVCGTVVRIPQQGLVIQPRTKTAAGWRTIAIPAYARDIARRRGRSPGPLFRTPVAGTLRDPDNMANELRRLLDGFDCEQCDESGRLLGPDGAPKLNEAGRPQRCDRGPWSWVTSHTFRKTVATKLDLAGFSAREVADHLGHANPSMTLDVYFGRHVASGRAAQALDR